MLKRLRPPTHKADVRGVYISGLDDAWDYERVEREVNAYVERKIAELPEAQRTEDARARLRDEVLGTPFVPPLHPVQRYNAGLTRFQVEAPDWDLEGKPVTAAEYLKIDARPARFVFRRLSWQQYESAFSADVGRIKLGELTRMSLVEIQDPRGNFNWRIDAPGALSSEEVVAALWDSDRDLHVDLGRAARLFSAPLMDHEGKPSGSGDTAAAPSQGQVSR